MYHNLRNHEKIDTVIEVSVGKSPPTIYAWYQTENVLVKFNASITILTLVE